MDIQLSDHFTTKKLIKYALPSIGMMIFTSIYGVVDGFFVSNFAGKTQFAAINLVMPFIMILSAMGFMLGTGGTALVSMLLGAEEKEKANRTFSMIIEVAVICGILASVVGFFFAEKVSLLLGATEEMLPYCILYCRLVVVFAVAFMLQQMFQTFFAAAQKPKLGFRYTVAAGLTNIIGDAVLVGVLKLGLVGAALATGIGMVVGGILPLIYFVKKNDSLLQFKLTKIELSPIVKACTNGVSEMVSNIAMSVVSVVYNFQLMKYMGENGVAAYGVIMYVLFIFAAVNIGFVMGTAPITAFHFGAGNKKELLSLLKKSLIIVGSVSVCLVALAELLAYPVSYLYVGYDAELLKLTVTAFRVYSIAFFFSGINIYASGFFTALNNGIISAIISFVRTFIFEIISVIIMPLILGPNGIWCSIIVAEVGAMILSVSFIGFQCKKFGWQFG